MEIKKTFTILNTKGLHGRASAKFVETIEPFESEVTVSKDGIDSNGRSIMGLLLLTAVQKSQIEVKVNGRDAEKCIQAIESLIENMFGEEFWTLREILP